MNDTAPYSKPNPITLIFGGLLIAAAFFIGMLWTKVQNLESPKVTGNVAGEQQVAQPAAKVADQAPEPVVNIKDLDPVNELDHVQGNRAASVTLIEYSDLECPFCKRYHPTIQKILETYGDKVAHVYRHFPLSFHPYAQKLAEASECAADQDKFWEFADAVYAEAELDDNTAVNIATSLDLDLDAFNTCVESRKYKEKVVNQMAGGQSAGVTGTPATFVLTKDGQLELISGAVPFEQIKLVLDKYIQ